jgi:hypothetical protein
MNYKTANQETEEHEDAFSLFRENGKNSYFVNSTSVFAEGQVITKSHTYILFDYPNDNQIQTHPVVLKNVYVLNDNVQLLLLNILTGRIMGRGHHLDTGETPCDWVLVDLDYFINKMNANAVKSYCERN